MAYVVSRIEGEVVRAESADGEVLFFVTNSKESIQRFHHKGEFYEVEDLIRIVRSFESAPREVLDVGANIGNHTLFFARMWPQSRIIPVEGFREVLELLKINVALNRLKNVDLSLLGYALGNRRAYAEVNSPHENNRGLAKMEVSQSGQVPIECGDSLVDSNCLDLMKIDVEGMEIAVLEGLSDTITTNRPKMFIEVNNNNDRRFHGWLEENRYQVEFEVRRHKINKNYMISAM